MLFPGTRKSGEITLTELAARKVAVGECAYLITYGSNGY